MMVSKQVSTATVAAGAAAQLDAATLAQWRDVAVTMTRGAGEVVRTAYREAFTVVDKGIGDLVTDADKASEAYLVEAIKKQFPDHGIVAEESGLVSEAGGAAAQAGYRWVIDPIDGTVNFAHRLPFFGVLVALQRRCTDAGDDAGGGADASADTNADTSAYGGKASIEAGGGAAGARYETILGVTYDPIHEECFVAVRGGGATLNDAPIRVSGVSRLFDAVVGTGFCYDRLLRDDDNHREFCRLNLVSQGARRLGSAGLDIAYVAMGRVDAFWSYGLKLWDVAAGLLLIEEAGGAIANLKGEPLRYDGSFDGGVICTNGLLQNETEKAIASAQQVPINSRSGVENFVPAELAARVPAALR